MPRPNPAKLMLSQINLRRSNFTPLRAKLRELNLNVSAVEAVMTAERAERELDVLGIPVEARAGCTFDLTQASLFEGQTVVRLVLRRRPNANQGVRWTIDHVGSVAMAHRADETGILRLTMGAEEAARRKSENGAHKAKAGARAATAPRLRVVAA